MFTRKNGTAGTAAPSGKAADAGKPAVPSKSVSRSKPSATRASDNAAGGTADKAPKATAKGKLVYEARRAEKAGMGLEKWMAEKERRVHAERDAIARARRKADADRKTEAGKPGLLGRLRKLLDRAHRPI